MKNFSRVAYLTFEDGYEDYNMHLTAEPMEYSESNSGYSECILPDGSEDLERILRGFDGKKIKITIEVLR